MSQRLAAMTAFGQACSTNAMRVREAVQPVFDGLMQGVSEDSVVHILGGRLIDHARYINSVVGKAGTRDRMADHTECAFGRWYAAESGRWGHLPAWRAMDEPHRRVHETAQALVDHGKAEQAEAISQASLELLRCFVQLKEALKINL